MNSPPQKKKRPITSPLLPPLAHLPTHLSNDNLFVHKLKTDIFTQH